MSETEEQLKARLGRERKEKNEAVAREAAEARERLRNKPDSPRHVTFSDEPPPVTKRRPTYHSGPLESKHGSWTLTDEERAKSSFHEERLAVKEKPKEVKVVVKEEYTGHAFGAKHDKERSTGFGDTSKEAAMPMHLRLRDNRKGAMVLNKQGGKSPWRVSCEVGDLEGEWESERKLCFDSLQKIRKRDEDGNLEPGYDEDILPHQLKHANDRHKVKATHGVPDRTLRRYKGECDETLAGTNAKRKKWKRLEAAPSVDPMEVGDDADHMRAIAKKKKDELERAAAKMRARVEAYENRMIDDEADQIPKPEGMLSLELKQKRLQAEGKDLYGREAYELQFLSIRWIDKKMIRERQKKREAQLALRERWKNSVKVDEKKAETFLEKVKKRILRVVLGEKAVSRSMKGKGDPAFEKRMKVLNLARTCFMIMDADDSGTLSRDEILTAVREDKRVLGFLRECKEAVLRDLLVPERLEASLEEMDADKSGEIDMEEWINAVTLSLNAEMEREKKLQEEAMEKLAEVLEGEDLDAIEAAIEEAVAKGVAEEALAKARATHKKLERKQRGSRFSRGSRASRASRASRDSLPDEERSVKSDVLSVHADDAAAPAPAPAAPAPIEDEAAPPSSAAGRMEQASERPKTSRGPSTPRTKKRGWLGFGKKETPVSPPSAAVSPEKAGPASHGTPGGPAEAPAEAPAEGDRLAQAARDREAAAARAAAKEKEYAEAEAARVAAEERRAADEELAKKVAAEEKAAADELAARAAKPQIDAILADRDTSKQQKILAINRLKDLPATVKQRAMQAAQTGKDFTI